jgi:hypothetical protein
VAWSKGLFDTLFTTDISLLQKILSQGNDNIEMQHDNTEMQHERGLAVLDYDILLEEGVARRLLNNILWPLYTPDNTSLDTCGLDTSDRNMIQGSIVSALITFQELFNHDIATLIAEHPRDSLEENDFEQKTLFWGKSRKFPQVVKFDKSLSAHKAFVLHAARILCRSRGLNVSSSEMENVYKSSIDSILSRVSDHDSPLDLLFILSHQPYCCGDSSNDSMPSNIRRPPHFYIDRMKELLATARPSEGGEEPPPTLLHNLQQQSAKIQIEHFLKV